MSKYAVLPKTPWTATSLWSFEPRSLMVLLLTFIGVGLGEGLLLLSDLGSAPWTILSQGLALQMGVSVGWTSFIISLVVMLFWLPLRLRPGIGTLLNVAVIAFFLGLTVKMIPSPTALFTRWLYALVGILFLGIGTAFYLTCHQGAGPRDGLMVGLCQRFHWKIGIVRTSIEVLVCLLGFLLGGTLGLGTLVFALSIGWVVQLTLIFIRTFA
ncbi:YczE/YyaS/YitT family protein [Actinobacillus porcinus]|uniref:membrane protein YczE n=1 Tax=Actinobacillus porcinus TaxID=51048 RepID=UPI00235635C9|nr:YitT family protein [Actinobacillus porcinus]